MQTSTSTSASPLSSTSASAAGIRYSALSLGLFFLMLGLAGFVPAFVAPPNFIPAAGFGYLFGLFPTNYFHNAIGILMGLWGIAAFTSLSSAIVFNRIFAIVYAASAIFGLLPWTNTLFGTIPLLGNNVWINALAAGIAFYYGFVKSAAIPSIGSSPAQPTPESPAV